MKREFEVTFSIATVTLALFLAQSAQAQDANSMQTTQSNTAPLAGTHEAMLMVPARAALAQSLDAKKIGAGQQFQATLSSTVHLKNGIELPRGTTLIGVVSADHMQQGGMSRLVLRFTKAELKDGKVVPIKATIVGVYAPESTSNSGYPVTPGDEDPNTWSNRFLRVDQIGALNGIDLHSRIASSDSGALVSSTKDEMKLQAGSEFALAIAARKNN
jgi:hypothetical protein